MDINIARIGSKISICGNEVNKIENQLINELDAKWSNGCWIIPANQESDLKQILNEMVHSQIVPIEKNTKRKRKHISPLEEEKLPSFETVPQELLQEEEDVDIC